MYRGEQKLKDERKASFKKRLLDEREHAILSTARRMFAERGYHGTNLNDVANEVGIARGTIYLHFATKDELLAAIIKNADEQLLNVLNDVIKPEDNPLDKLKKIFGEYLRTCLEYEDLIRVMSHELRKAAGSRLYENHNNPSVTDLVEKTIEEAKKKGMVDPMINTMIAANAFFSLVTIQTFRETREKGLGVDEVIDSAMRIYFKGIAKEEE